MFIDLHIYTDRYSEMRVMPIGAIHNAINKGLDGIVLIEKNRLWPDEELASLRREAGIPDSFRIFKGQQIECPEGDIVAIGCNEEFTNQVTSLEIKQKIKTQGGCSIFVPQKTITYEDYFGGKKKDATNFFGLFDAVEICNSKLDKKLLREFLDFARKKSICCVGGSASSQSSLYVTKFLDDIKDEKELARAILKKRANFACVDGHDIDPRGGKTTNIQWNVPKVSVMKVKGLIFDLYGTLVDLKSTESYEEFNKMAVWLSQENIQVSGSMLMNYYRERCFELYQSAQKRVKFPEVDILQVFRDAIGFFSGKDRGEEFARKSAMVFRTLTIKNIGLYPNTRAMLRELKRRKYRMGIISNAQAAFTMPEIEDLKLEQFFDFIILSSDVGCSKPDSSIYKIASRQIELESGQTAFIGDDLHGDIYGAQNHGFKSVYIKTNVGTSKYPVTPDVTIADGDLRNLLRIFP